MTTVDTRLTDQAQWLCADECIRHAVWRHCQYLGEHAALETLDTDIHAQDQMLLHSLQHHQDANAAVSQYFNIALQQYNCLQQVVRTVLPARRADWRLLDFACGYGRLLRFLRHSLTPGSIWAAEIQRDAVFYVADRFGVQGLLSTSDPADFDPGERFDLIWVASLFSHLPEGLFEAWLTRLMALLRPGGVLAFTVHDQCLLPAELTLPESGLLYGHGSEIPELDTSIYGVSYVSEAFVRRAVSAATSTDHPCRRLPKALAHEQDLYLVPRDAAHDLSGLSGFRRGPWGWVDEREVLDSGALHLRGWAASLDDGALASVEIHIDGQRHDCATGQPREDVVSVFKDDRLLNSGWEFHLALPTDTERVCVEVTARSARDEMALLFTGLLDNPAWREASPRPAENLLGRIAARLRRGAGP